MSFRLPSLEEEAVAAGATASATNSGWLELLDLVLPESRMVFSAIIVVIVLPLVQRRAVIARPSGGPAIFWPAYLETGGQKSYGNDRRRHQSTDHR